MDKRLEKRHKRQVARARAKVKVSEPDLRTPEQIRAAREASRPDLRNAANVPYAAPDSRKTPAPASTDADEPAS